MNGKKRFLFYNDRLDYMQEMGVEEKAEFLETILKYQNGEDVNPITGFRFVWKRIKSMMDQDKDKRDKKAQVARENGKNGGRPKKPKETDNNPLGYLVTQKNPEKPVNVNVNVNDNVNVNVNDNVNVNVNDNVNVNVNDNISTIVDTKAIAFEKFKKNELSISINKMIEAIKTKCEEDRLPYNNKQDRNFAKHLCVSISYLDFCKKRGKTPEQMAVGIIEISKEYRKGARTGPMTIYQDYVDVVNSYLSKTKKQESKIIQRF